MPPFRKRQFVFASCLAGLIGIIWYIAYATVTHENNKTTASEARRARQLAQFFEGHVEDIFRTSDNYVKSIRRAYNAGSIKAVRDLIEAMPPDTKIVSHVSVIDKNGTPLLISGHKIKPGSSAQDRNYFRFQKNSDSDKDDVFISLPLRGRNTGILTLRVVRRIITPDGKFGGVVFAAVKIGPITEFFKALSLGENSSATLIGTDKMIRARSSYGRLGPGQNISGSRIWRELAQSPTGLYRQISVVDGITRFYAYRKLMEFPLVVAIGVSLSDISAAVTQFKIDAYLIATLGSLLIVVLFFFINNERRNRTKLEADIAVRKETERSLQESEERYRRISEILPDGIFIHTDGIVVYANASMARILGAESPDRLIGMRSLDFIVSEQHQEVIERRKQTIISPMRQLSEGRFLRFDGSESHVERVASPIIWRDQPSIMLIVRDINERKKAEAALRESETQLRIVADASPVMISYIDRDRIVRFANKAFAARHGLTPDEIVGRHRSEYWGEGEHQTAEYLIENTLAGNVTSNESVREYADGTIHHHFVTRAPHFDENGEVVGYFNIILDMTDQKRTEEQLRQAQKMEAVGQLTGGVAHDFNNLLTVILGSLEFIEQRLDDRQMKNMARNAIDAARRGADLTQRLLSYARKQSLAPKVISLNECIGGMAHLLRATVGEAIEVEANFGDDIWPCMVDPSQFENAILNLAINARDAMPLGGRLTIETMNTVLGDDFAAAHPGFATGDYVMVSVSDTGAGIAQEILHQVFEPFFTTKEVGAGSGLGLSMVHGFIKQSGGEVGIESEPGKGTTVRLYLPKSAELGVPFKPATGDQAPPGRGEKILLVEDQESVRAITVNMLGELGYQVVEATKASEALEILQSAPEFDLLLSDIVLPGGMDGMDLAATVRRMNSSIKILFISGYADHVVTGEGEFGDRLKLLRKPYNKSALGRKLRFVLDAAPEPL